MGEYIILEPPTNYTGSKHKLIPQLIKYFPKDVDVFYDVFCGGLSVTINTNYERYVANDIITPLVEFYRMIYIAAKENRINDEISKILEFKIPKDDQDIYNKLRSDFNLDKDPYKLFSLICSCTNNLMRFSKKLNFNQTWGKRNISDKTVNKLHLYMDRLKEKELVFTNYSFENLFERNCPTKNDFVYCDIPYEGTDCGYGVFSKEVQKLFFNKIDELNSKGI